MEKTAFASRYSSALPSFSPHPCRERIYPFRFFSGALGLLRIRLLPLPGVETMEETMAATRYSSALLNFSPNPCREQACPFRLPRFCLHPPVGTPQ